MKKHFHLTHLFFLALIQNAVANMECNFYEPNDRTAIIGINFYCIRTINKEMKVSDRGYAHITEQIAIPLEINDGNHARLYRGKSDFLLSEVDFRNAECRYEVNVGHYIPEFCLLKKSFSKLATDRKWQWSMMPYKIPKQWYKLSVPRPRRLTSPTRPLQQHLP